MAETLTVALQVAEEAVDEAISKAEFDTASQVSDVLLIICYLNYSSSSLSCFQKCDKCCSTMHLDKDPTLFYQVLR